MKGFGWNWTKSEYPMIVLWIILVLFYVLDTIFRNQKIQYLKIWNNYSLIILLIIFILGVASSIYLLPKKDIPVDERTIKINYKAKNHSWSATYVIVIVLSFIGQKINLTLIQVGLLIILSMITTQFILVIYFNKKGDDL